MSARKISMYAVGILFAGICMFQNTNLSAQDKEWPEPVVIEPGKKGKAPSDAIVLFDGDSLSNFERREEGGPVLWKVNGKKITVVGGTGDIVTKQKFGNCQVHLEWRTPVKDVKENREGQGCGNSGIYFMKWFEVQVLNSYINKTYFDGQAGAIYTIAPPLVNASLKPGKWQTYDIIFTAPIFDTDGSVKSFGYFTVFHNGVLIQNHVRLGKMISSDDEKATGEIFKMPILLQDHGNEVSYRNMWIREL